MVVAGWSPPTAELAPTGCAISAQRAKASLLAAVAGNRLPPWSCPQRQPGLCSRKCWSLAWRRLCADWSFDAPWMWHQTPPWMTSSTRPDAIRSLSLALAPRHPPRRGPMTRGTPLASIHRVAEKAHSRKPGFRYWIFSEAHWARKGVGTPDLLGTIDYKDPYYSLA